MKSTVRAFVAIEISLDVRRLAKKTLAPLKRAFPDVKWLEDENFHVTLKFLGPNVPVVELHKLIAALKRACRGVEQFDLVLEGLGAFPNASAPRTLWIGVTDGVDELRELAARIDEEFEKLGYPVEGRAFSPHLTIGRARRRDRDDAQGADATLADEIEKFGDFYWGCCPVDRVILFSSELERYGAKYEPLASVELAPLGGCFDEEDEAEREGSSKMPTQNVPKIPELDPERDKLRFTPRPPRNLQSDAKPNAKKNAARSNNSNKGKNNSPDVFNLTEQELAQFDALLTEDDVPEK